MRTRLFEWAAERGLSIADLSDRLGYSERHLYRIKNNEWPVTEEFEARVVLRLGNWARDLFLPDVSNQDRQ